MDIDVTHEQIAHWEQGVPIQQAMPNLSADEREFMMTGITPEEWNTHMGCEDDEADDYDDYDGQPSWEQEWEDFGEVYSDEY